MSSPRSSSTLGVAALLARMAARRRLNRILGNLGAAWRRKKKAEGRSATPRKTSRSYVALVLFGALFLFQSVIVSGRFVDGLVNHMETRAAVDRALAGGPIDEEAIGLGGPTLERPQDLRRPVAWPSTAAWPGPENERTVLLGLGLVLTVLVCALFFLNLGAGNEDLARVGWSMEWLFTFPVATRGLILAKIGEYTITNLFAWVTVFPFLVTVFWNSGHGAWGIATGLAGTIFVNALLGSLRIVAETWLRKRFALDRLKNVQALATVLGMMLLFATLVFVFSEKIPEPFFDVAGALPAAFLILPSALPILVAYSGAAAIALAGVGALVVYACMLLGAWLVRDGLVAAGASYRGTRGVTAPPASARLRGMLGKEAKLLWRDRTFFVQTIVMPLFFIGFQFIVNPEMFQSGAEPRIAAVIAYGVGAYVLVFGAFSVLAVETRGLWLLYTFPHSLARLLRQKVWLWTCVASIYTTALLALTWRPDASSSAADWLGAPLALLGVGLYAFLAAGMGVLGSDPLAQETSRKVRPEWSFLYMLLAAIFGFGISSEALWPKLVLVCLSVLVTYALWEKVRDRLPLLLDPTQTPPPRITLADGLIAALVFFQVQALFAFLFGFVMAGAGAGAQLVLAYAVSGVVTVLFALYIFWRTKVPDLLGAVGFRRGDVSGPTPSVAQLLGVGWGIAAALFSFVYLLGLQRFMPHLLDRPGLERDLGVGIVVLAVFLAPPFEEFIFRGLIYRGLLHGIGRTGAVLASAAVFALVHPPVSFLPVFVLGVACAICYERTRLLIAPITAHVVYNAAQFLVAPQILQ